MCVSESPFNPSWEAWRGLCVDAMSLISLVPFSFRSRHARPCKFRSASLQDPCCNSHIPLHLLRPERMCMQYWDVDLGSGRATSNACTGINTRANAETTLALDAKVMTRPTTPFQSKFKLCFRESPRGKGFHPCQVPRLLDWAISPPSRPNSDIANQVVVPATP